MTNYNDGKWIGWNGGECPVHPKSEVRMIWPSLTENGSPLDSTRTADGFLWSGMPCLFRVVKEHREPRERWAYLTHMFDTEAKAEAFRAQLDAAHPGRGYLDTPITHWREVV